jgi:hypothetical protein
VITTNTSSTIKANPAAIRMNRFMFSPAASSEAFSGPNRSHGNVAPDLL